MDGCVGEDRAFVRDLCHQKGGGGAVAAGRIFQACKGEEAVMPL